MKFSAFLEAKQWFRYFGYVFSDIEKAIKLGGKYPVEMVRPTEEMMGSLVNVDEEYAKTVDLAKPVVFASVVAGGKVYHILIDGHHRLRRALADGAEEIPSVTLSVKDTLSVMEPNRTTAAMRSEAKKLRLL